VRDVSPRKRFFVSTNAWDAHADAHARLMVSHSRRTTVLTPTAREVTTKSVSHLRGLRCERVMVVAKSTIQPRGRRPPRTRRAKRSPLHAGEPNAEPLHLSRVSAAHTESYIIYLVMATGPSVLRSNSIARWTPNTTYRAVHPRAAPRDTACVDPGLPLSV